MKTTNPVVDYLQGSVEELRKVTWPTKEQTLRLTIIVSVFSLLTAAVLGVLDLGFDEAFRWVISKF